LKYLASFAALACAAVVALLALSNQSSAGAAATRSPWKAETLHYFLAHETGGRIPADRGRKYAFGDRYVYRYEILNRAGGKRIGYAGFDCGLIAPEDGVCNGTLVLPGGSITTASDQVDGKQVALSGGTGRYEGALGEWKWSLKTPGDFTVHLLLPNR